MSTENNTQVVEKWFEALNANDTDGLEQYRAPGYEFVAPTSQEPIGAAEETASTKALHAAVSDVHYVANETVAQGDLVVVNGVMTGTNDGPYVLPDGTTFPASGRPVTLPFSNTFKFANGKIVRNTLYYDMSGPMVQMGMTPET